MNITPKNLPDQSVQKSKKIKIGVDVPSLNGIETESSLNVN
jgi:hypothetical protein